MPLSLSGDIDYDKYESRTGIKAKKYDVGAKGARMDTAEEKRVELHMHTNMSAMDAITPASEADQNSHRWGHKAVLLSPTMAWCSLFQKR